MCGTDGMHGISSLIFYSKSRQLLQISSSVTIVFGVLILSLLAETCCLLIIFTNSLDPNQKDRKSVLIGPTESGF